MSQGLCCCPGLTCLIPCCGMGVSQGAEDKAPVHPLPCCTFFTDQLHSQLSCQRQGLGTSALGYREPRSSCVPCPNGKAPATGFRKLFWWFPWDTSRSWLFSFSVTSRPWQVLQKLQRLLSSMEFCLLAVLAGSVLAPQCKPRLPPCAFLNLPNIRLVLRPQHCTASDCRTASSPSHLHASLYSATNKLRPKALCKMSKMSYRHLQLGRSQGFTSHTAILI